MWVEKYATTLTIPDQSRNKQDGVCILSCSYDLWKLQLHSMEDGQVHVSRSPAECSFYETKYIHIKPSSNPILFILLRLALPISSVDDSLYIILIIA